MARTKKHRGEKKPAIPQSRRIKYSLEDVKGLYQRLHDLHGTPSGEEVDLVWNDYVKACIRLVHLDNSQLKNPILGPLLSSPEVKGKELLRTLHRGLEKGQKKTMTMKQLFYFNVLTDGLNKGFSLERIKRGLDGMDPKKKEKLKKQGIIIKPISVQALHKYKKSLTLELDKASKNPEASLRADNTKSPQKR